MKKAVITTGSKQYVVSEGDKLAVEKLKTDKKSIAFTPLLVIDGETVKVGKPEVTGASVEAEITIPELKADKVTSIRYKAKKRVKKVRGHRQILSEISIKKIKI